MSDHSNAMKLPVWLKVFSSSKPKDIGMGLDKEVLQRIARALRDNKSVVVLQDGKPVKIVRQDDSVSIESVKATYVLE